MLGLRWNFWLRQRRFSCLFATNPTGTRNIQEFNYTISVQENQHNFLKLEFVLSKLSRQQACKRTACSVDPQYRKGACPQPPGGPIHKVSRLYGADVHLAKLCMAFCMHLVWPILLSTFVEMRLLVMLDSSSLSFRVCREFGRIVWWLNICWQKK